MDSITYSSLWHRLAPLYGENEAKAIARQYYEVGHGLSMADLCLGRETALPQAEVEQAARRLERAEPVQYVLGQADFCGRSFRVSPSVLIPRPETEELCRWAVTTGGSNVLDIGTGSGCIAVTLAAALPQARVTAWDISAEALKVARENAERARVHVSFAQVDILHPSPNTQHPAPSYDLIVSNPPYICDKERAQMEANVLDYEPHTALFVPDDDPLLFYRAIARYGLSALQKGGWLYFEVNPLYADALARLLSEAMSYHDMETKEDPFGKTRYIRARR